VQIFEYLDVAGDSPYRDWFEGLDAQAAAKVTVALTRIELGNLSNVKGVGTGVQEYRIDFGPGYRIYFGRDGDRLVILLAGGRRAASRTTSRPRRSDGPTTRSEKMIEASQARGRSAEPERGETWH
jgi:putative addiction module killer protein